MKSKGAEDFTRAFRSMPDKVVELYYEFAKGYLANEAPEYLFFLNEYIVELTQCESPIEQILLLMLKLFSDYLWLGYEFEVQKDIQIEDKTYRADIYYTSESFMPNNPYRLVIECDGHEFHEATKEQVAKRNDRDLDLKNAGYDVLHFSGSQIYNDPYKYSKKIGMYINQKVVERLHGNIQASSSNILDGHESN